MMDNVVRSLASVQVPIKRNTINRLMRIGGLSTFQDLRFEQIKINQQKKTLLGKALSLLNHDEIAELAKKGQLAFGVLRPRAFESHIGIADDDAAAEALLNELPHPVKPIFTMPVVFNRFMTHKFWYKPEYEDIPPIKHTMYNNVWEEFVVMMTAGASTVYLAHSPLSNTVHFLREKIGPWKNPPPETIRGKLAKKEKGGILNNLIHLSDQDRVLSEIKILSEELEKIL